MNQTKLTKFFKIKSPRINDMDNFIQKTDQKNNKNNKQKNDLKTDSKINKDNSIINKKNNNLQKRYIMRFDGASRGNPGKAGAGAVIYENDKEIWTTSRYLGIQTNNYAECFAMVLGIEEAYNRGIRNLLVEGDSMLIINQLKGKWQIKNKDLKDLHLSIVLILKSFNSIIYNHIYRNFNSRADELANLSFQKEK